jgi:hypothetical protein
MVELGSLLEQCHDQFLLTRGATDLPRCFALHEHAGWTLAAHRTLRVRAIEGAAGRHVGWLLGEAIDERGEPVGTGVRLAGADAAEAAQRWCDEHGGRFAVVLVGGAKPRLYLDAAGSLATVFSGRRRAAGSTVTLLLAGEPGHPYFQLDTESYPSGRPNKYFPAGLTAATDVERVLPNHYLDLRRWEAARYRPVPPVEPVDTTDRRATDRLVEGIVELIGANLRGAVSVAGRAYLPLTAGRDSRVVAVAARRAGLLDTVTFVTLDRRKIPTDDALDVGVARAIAQRWRLSHQVLPVPRGGEGAGKLEYLLRIGFSGSHGKRRDFYEACRDGLDPGAAWVTGFGGEVGRARYWPPGHESTWTLTGRALTTLIRQPPEARTIQAMERWRHGMTERHPCTIVDLAYWEHRLGCWASPHLYGAAPFALNLMAFNHRRILESMLRLPVAHRREQQLCTQVCRRWWPGLLDYPMAHGPRG